LEIIVAKEKLEKNKLVEISTSPKIIGFFDGEKYYAFSGICPHAKWPLEIGTVSTKTLTCAGHGWEFNIENGACVSNPGRDLKSFKIKDEKDKIIIIS